jgi:hypothetical protein
MAMLVITTQIFENYGAHSWDGVGACPQRWKPKGGRDHKVRNIDPNRSFAVYESVVDRVTENNDYFCERVLDYRVEADDWLSEFEQSQLERDGEIRFPEPEIDWREHA